jgi:KUP system potassium uptake protein
MEHAAPRASRAHLAKTPHSPPSVLKLSLGALGVVYGDIGTSPIYTMKECFSEVHGVGPSELNVLGILSLVFWSLTWVIVVKYLTFVMRADNHGEGGTFALLALVTSGRSRTTGWVIALSFAGLFGASLLYGEGIITPAISVLSAVEGLGVATHVLDPVVVPITVVILVGLFLVQKRGTAKLGAVLGPLTLLWFATIVAMGVPWIIQQPKVFYALNPYYAVEFFLHNGLHGFLILGSVVLCITGGEALYADMGHFGRRPIRIAWSAVVYPALLVNYFGQGALLLSRGRAVIAHPFYAMVDGWMIYPVVLIATIATIIASQALISGAFSLTQQAVQLGYVPRVNIVHTSGEQEGQIYIPEVNAILMVSCIALVLGFRESSALAAAYGIAVTGTMSVTSLLFFEIFRKRWGNLRAGTLLVLFLAVDLTFFSSNVVKIKTGGWVPLLMGSVLFAVMTTWKRGRAELGKFVREMTVPLEPFLDSLQKEKPHRVEGTAVFMTQNAEGLPPALRHHFKHNHVLHEKVVLLTVVTEHVPEIPRSRRVSVKALGQGFYHVVAYYGFLQTPRVAGIFRACKEDGLEIEMDETSFYLGRESLITTGNSKMFRWRKMLFSFLSRNARTATAYFDIPPDRVVELGMQFKL